MGLCPSMPAPKRLVHRHRFTRSINQLPPKEIWPWDLHDFIRDNNPHGLQIFAIGGTGEAGRFKGLPCDEITCDGADYFEWMEKEVDQRDRNAGFLRLDGVFCETSGLARFLKMPLFVREVKLSR